MRPKHLAGGVLSALLVSAIFIGSNCVQKSEAPAQLIKDISAQEAFNLIQDKQGNPDFIIIDVRTPEEFTDGHIENAINIDYLSENFEGELSQLDKDNIYLIYCRTSNRSREALSIMVELGFKEVYHLSTGIIGWLEEGFPVIK